MKVQKTEILIKKKREFMVKQKIGVVFGGVSTEHDVSMVSGTSILKNLDKEKYEIFPIYIDLELINLVIVKN